MNRQLQVGDVIRRTFQIYVEQAPVLMPAAAVVFTISSILSLLLVAVSPALVIIALMLTVLASVLFTGMLVELVADLQDGRRDATSAQLVHAAWPMLWPLINVGLLAGIGIALGVMALLVPGLVLMTIWSVAAPVVVIERVGAVRALGRSRELVRGHGLNVFLVIVVLVILVVLLGGAVELAANAAGAAVGLIVRVIVGVLSAPISSLACAVLYFQLRALAPGDELPGAAHM